MLKKRRIQKKIRQELESNPKWNFIVEPESWLCPYCGELGATNLSMKGKIEGAIFTHFNEECTSWNYFEGEEIDLESLEERALLLTLKRQIPHEIAENDNWHISDSRLRWFCPFCLHSTDLELDPSGHALPTPQQYFEHLQDCEDYLKREGKAHDYPKIKEARERENQKHRLNSLRKKIASQPEWQILDKQSYWHCPYCLARADFQLTRGKIDTVTVQKIHKHLSSCSKYKGGKGTIQSQDNVKKALAKSNKNYHLHHLLKQVTSDTLWQLLTKRGFWFCPFCAEPTGVHVRDFNWKDAVPHIQKHLEDCEERKYSRTPKEFTEIKEALKAHNRAYKIATSLEGKIGDPIFRCSLKTGQWVCPYCAEPQNFSLPKNSEQALNKICRHLDQECGEYHLKTLPSHTMESLNKHIKTKLQGKGKSLEKQTHLNLPAASEKEFKMVSSLPEANGVEFQSLYKPCSKIGGDFFHITDLGKNRWGIAVGDTSAQGPEAVALVKKLKALFDRYGPRSKSAGEVLARANRGLMDNLQGHTFVTTFYSILNLEKKTMRIANAGHLPILLYNQEREVPLQLVNLDGEALGLVDVSSFLDQIEEAELQLKSGDVILQNTDGLIQAENVQGQKFGDEKLYNLLEKYGKYELEYLLYKIEKALTEFTGRGPKDDVTILTFQV